MHVAVLKKLVDWKKCRLLKLYIKLFFLAIILFTLKRLYIPPPGAITVLVKYFPLLSKTLDARLP